MQITRTPDALPLIDRDSAQRFLTRVLPDWEWFLSHLESERGHLRFPAQIGRMILNLKVQNYPLLYENEALIGAVLLRGFFSDDEIAELNRSAEEASPTERAGMIEAIGSELDQWADAFELPKTPADERRALQAWAGLTDDEQQAAVRVFQHLLMGFLAIFYQNLSVMVHGEKLTSLVAQAKAGDDTALAKVVQIDNRSLTTIPYFRNRFADAGLVGDVRFKRELAYRTSAPPYRGKIRHKALWLTFSFLDSVGLLPTMRHEALLDFCDQVGLGRFPNRIDDVKNLGKRLAEFRRFRDRGVILQSTP